LSWKSCHVNLVLFSGCPLLPIQFYRSYSAGPIWWALSSCPVLAVLFLLSCPPCPLLALCMYRCNSAKRNWKHESMTAITRSAEAWS
jgi:hypothetical protein